MKGTPFDAEGFYGGDACDRSDEPAAPPRQPREVLRLAVPGAVVPVPLVIEDLDGRGALAFVRRGPGGEELGRLAIDGAELVALLIELWQPPAGGRAARDETSPPVRREGE